jgi:hypothetical protein
MQGTCFLTEILHLKAIEIAGKYLPSGNDFFTHLINSFNKNYKCIMDEIVATLLFRKNSPKFQ